MAKSKSDIPLGGAEQNMSREELAAVAKAVAALSPEDRDLLAAVQESPYRLTTAEQFLEFEKNVDCFVLWKDDRFWTSRKKELTKKMAADLLKKGRTSVKGMWSEKKGAAYDAVVVLDDTGEKYVRFKLEFPKRKEGVNGKK